MLSANSYMRIKANAQVFGVDLTQLGDDILLKLFRAAKANQWAIVEETIQELREAKQMKCDGDKCSRSALLGEDYCADCLRDEREGKI